MFAKRPRSRGIRRAQGEDRTSRPDENYADSELSKLQGTWNKHSVRDRGRPNEIRERCPIIFHGNQFVITDGFNVLKGAR